MAQGDYIDGFGIVSGGGLKIWTVSETRRAAIINWLVRAAGRWVSTSTTDEQIETMWLEEQRDALVMPVRCYVQ